jgi:hypothetical protein
VPRAVCGEDDHPGGVRVVRVQTLEVRSSPITAVIRSRLTRVYRNVESLLVNLIGGHLPKNCSRLPCTV